MNGHVAYAMNTCIPVASCAMRCYLVHSRIWTDVDMLRSLNKQFENEVRSIVKP